MTSRAVGWDVLRKKLGEKSKTKLVNKPHADMQQILQEEMQLPSESRRGILREKTRWNLQKLLKYRSSDVIEEIAEKAAGHIVCTPLSRSVQMKPKQSIRMSFLQLLWHIKHFMRRQRTQRYPRDSMPDNWFPVTSELPFGLHKANLVQTPPHPGDVCFQWRASWDKN
jgi:hypothetical protein